MQYSNLNLPEDTSHAVMWINKFMFCWLWRSVVSPVSKCAWFFFPRGCLKGDSGLLNVPQTQSCVYVLYFFLLFLFSPILSSQEVNIPWNAWSPRRGLRVSLTDIVMGMAVFAPETQFQSDSCWWTNHCTNQQHEKKCNILQGPVWSGNLCFNCVFCQTDVYWYQSEWCALLVVCRI